MFAAMTGLSEFVGGLLLTVGLLTPLGNGIELPCLFAAAALGLVFTRAGVYSLDNVFDVTFFSEPYIVATLLVLTMVSTGVILGLRTHDQPQTAAPQRAK